MLDSRAHCLYLKVRGDKTIDLPVYNRVHTHKTAEQGTRGEGRGQDGSTKTFSSIVRIDTPEDLVAFSHGGILPYVVRQLVAKS